MAVFSFPLRNLHSPATSFDVSNPKSIERIFPVHPRRNGGEIEMNKQTLLLILGIMLLAHAPSTAHAQQLVAGDARPWCMARN